MFKFTVLQRMTLTALLFAFSVIATRFIGVYVTPFVRLSAGVAIIIYSSILLGPISGAIVGGLGDIIGILLVPAGSMAINPFITLTYTLMGAVPGLIMMLFRRLKKKDLIYSIIFFAFLLMIFISLTVYMTISNEITMFDMPTKVDGVVMSSDYGCMKPESHLFEVICNNYGIDKNKAVMIGDSMSYDIAGISSSESYVVAVKMTQTAESTIKSPWK